MACALAILCFIAAASLQVHAATYYRGDFCQKLKANDSRVSILAMGPFNWTHFILAGQGHHKSEFSVYLVPLARFTSPAHSANGKSFHLNLTGEHTFVLTPPFGVSLSAHNVTIIGAKEHSYLVSFNWLNWAPKPRKVELTVYSLAEGASKQKNFFKAPRSFKRPSPTLEPLRRYPFISRLTEKPSVTYLTVSEGELGDGHLQQVDIADLGVAFEKGQSYVLDLPGEPRQQIKTPSATIDGGFILQDFVYVLCNEEHKMYAFKLEDEKVAEVHSSMKYEDIFQCGERKRVGAGAQGGQQTLVEAGEGWYIWIGLGVLVVVIIGLVVYFKAGKNKSKSESGNTTTQDANTYSSNISNLASIKTDAKSATKSSTGSSVSNIKKSSPSVATSRSKKPRSALSKTLGQSLQVRHSSKILQENSILKSKSI